MRPLPESMLIACGQEKSLETKVVIIELFISRKTLYILIIISWNKTYWILVFKVYLLGFQNSVHLTQQKALVSFSSHSERKHEK